MHIKRYFKHFDERYKNYPPTQDEREIINQNFSRFVDKLQRFLDREGKGLEIVTSNWGAGGTFIKIEQTDGSLRDWL